MALSRVPQLALERTFSLNQEIALARVKKTKHHEISVKNKWIKVIKLVANCGSYSRGFLLYMAQGTGLHEMFMVLLLIYLLIVLFKWSHIAYNQETRISNIHNSWYPSIN